METTLLNTLEKLISDYNTKSLSPTWFRELSKTLLSKNISMEDWNTSQHYLKNLAAQNEALYEFCQSIVEIINNSKPKLKTIGGTSLTGEGNIVEFENMYRFDGNDGNIGFGFTDEGHPCIKNKGGNILQFTNTEYDDSYEAFEFPEQGGKVVVRNYDDEIEYVSGIYYDGTENSSTAIYLGRLGDEVCFSTYSCMVGFTDPEGFASGDYMHHLWYPKIKETGITYSWTLPAKNGEILVVDKEESEDLVIDGIATSYNNPETDYPTSLIRLSAVQQEVLLASEECTIMLTTPQAVGDAGLGHKLYYPDGLLEEGNVYEWTLPPQTGGLRVGCADDVPLETDGYGEYSSHAYLVEIKKTGTYRLYLERYEESYGSDGGLTYTLDFIIDDMILGNYTYKASNVIMTYMYGLGVVLITAILIKSLDDPTKHILMLECINPREDDSYKEINMFEYFENVSMEYKGN